METLVVVAQHRDEYHGRSSRNLVMGPARFGAFGSPPSNGFRDINCRTFQSGAGILPTPMRTCSTPLSERAVSLPSFSPKTPTPPVNTVHTEPKKHSKRVALRSCSLPIPISFKQVDSNGALGAFGDDCLYSELWAGPAYSNSPPPSSLPIPKFSVVRPKRTVSLELPSVSACEIDLLPLAKSAPASPTSGNGFTKSDFFNRDESATKTLCRMLNLDLTDQ